MFGYFQYFKGYKILLRLKIPFNDFRKKKKILLHTISNNELLQTVIVIGKIIINNQE